MAWIETRKRKRRKGIAVVEMALVAPLLFILLFGVLDYGWYFLKAEQVSDAARRGARQAVTPGVVTDAQITDPTYVPTPAAIQTLEDAGIPIKAGTVTVPTGVIPGTGNIVTVVVTVPYSDVDPFGFSLIPMPSQIQASVSMVKEGL